MNQYFSKNIRLRAKFPSATLVFRGKSGELINVVNDREGHYRRYAIDARKESMS